MVLRGDSVKDDTGGCAVFTEQGASASHMTAAEVLDTISQLPGMSGEANDAVSAHAQVKMSDASRLLEILETDCPTVWIWLPRNSPKHEDNIDGAHLYGHPLAGLLCERRLEEVLLEKGKLNSSHSTSMTKHE